jgi:hypothetical protein
MGLENNRFAKACIWGDLDGDSWPDLLISNFSGVNRLFRNREGKAFEEITEQAGLGDPFNSFVTWFWDQDNDGNLDIYISSYDFVGEILGAVVADRLNLPHGEERPRLLRGDGKGGFTEISEGSGLTAVSLPMGANFGDVDGDGLLDFYLGTGYPEYEALMPNVMYRNLGGGRFEEVTFAGGLGHLQKGHAVVFADLDNDGDQDILQQIGGFFPGDKYGNALFENPGFGNNWLNLHLVGVTTNRSAIGARIRAEINDGGKQRQVFKTVNSGGSFGANPLRQNIGLGKAQRIDVLTIEWPTSGTTQTFKDVAANHFVRVVENQKDLEILSITATKLGGQ